MKRRYLLLAPLLILSVAGAAYALTRPGVPEDLDYGLTQRSASGLYEVTLTPGVEPVPVGQMHAWVVTVADAYGQPVDASVVFDGGMPQHGHGLPTVPRVMSKDELGRHIVGGVRFNMPGWWVLEVAVSGAEGEDMAVFNLAL